MAAAFAFAAVAWAKDFCARRVLDKARALGWLGGGMGNEWKEQLFDNQFLGLAHESHTVWAKALPPPLYLSPFLPVFAIVPQPK